MPSGVGRIPIAISIGDRIIKAELNAKSLRKTIATIAEHGPDAVAVIIQGKLAGSHLEEAGINAQLKGKPAG